MRSSPRQLWQQLQQAHLVSQDYSGEQDSALHMRIFLGLTAYFTAFCCVSIIFLFASFLSESALTYAILGLLVLGVSLWLTYRCHGQFVRQLELVFALAAQVLLVTAIDRGKLPFLECLLIQQVVFFFLFNSYLLRVLSAILAGVAIVGLLEWGRFAWLTMMPPAALLTCILLINQFRWTRFNDWLKPLSDALQAGLVLLMLARLLMQHEIFYWKIEDQWLWWQDWPLMLVVAGCALWLIFRQPASTAQRGLMLLLGALLLGADIFIPCLALLALLVALNFKYGQTLQLISTLGLSLAVLFMYYYSLEATLMDKAIILFVLGVVLLLLRWLLLRFWQVGDAPEGGTEQSRDGDQQHA